MGFNSAFKGLSRFDSLQQNFAHFISGKKLNCIPTESFRSIAKDILYGLNKLYTDAGGHAL
jgi:hypothetical protein